VAGVLAQATVPAFISPKYHSSGFDDANGGMDGEEFAGRAGAESVSIVYAKAIRDPIEFVSRELGELIGSIGCGREGLLKLIVGLTVIPTHSNTTIFNIYVLWGVLGGLMYDVWAGCRGGFELCVETAGEHFVSPSSQYGDSAWSPFRSRYAYMLPITLKV
jgi:hypothetical protein